MKSVIKPIFLCELPPPYGGVTVKNQLIRDVVFMDGEEVEVVDFSECKRRRTKIPLVFFRMIFSFIHRRSIIYGFGSYKRLEVAIWLQRIIGGKKSIECTINLVMGGIFHEYIKEKPKLKKLLKMMKANYVETEGMVRALHSEGLENVRYFPNARSEIESLEPKIVIDGSLKCVFFSQISTYKGVREILHMYDLLTITDRSKLCIDFYGQIVDEIRADFEDFIANKDNVRYCGVFDAVNHNVCQKLNEYDVLLFPTRWVAEGVPGILVEAKMAGICPIVSNWRYNSEIILDGIEGIIIEEPYFRTMAEIVKLLLNDKEMLNRLKKGSYESRTRYAMESFVDELKMMFIQDFS